MGWFGKWFGIKKYQHNGYGRSVTQSDGPIDIPFTAVGTQTIDSLRIQLGNTGNVAATVTLRFIDDLTGKTVGNSVQTTVTTSTALTAVSLSGFAAGIQKAREYILRIEAALPSVNTYTAPAQSSATYTMGLIYGGFAVGSIPAQWRIAVTGGCLPIGGKNGYQSTGTAVRTLNMTAYGAVAPSVNGIVTFDDTVPTGTSMTITAYYTNSASLAAASGTSGWALHGTIASGDTLPAAIYWRMVIVMNATTTNDDAPTLGSLSIAYLADPLVFGTHGQRVTVTGYGNSYTLQAIKAVNSISSSTSALDASAKKVMIGQLTIELAPERVVESLFQRPLRGRRVMVRVGYSDVPDTMMLYEGVVRDLAFHAQRYTLTVQDSVTAADVSVPRDKWPAWVSTTAYAGGDIITYGNKSYLCLVANTGQQPDTSPTYWQDNGTVWKDIVYTAGTHLCDIAQDLLTNQVNLPSEKVNITSLTTVKAAQPGMTIASTRTISSQEKALDDLADIAWLLDSFWTLREGRFSLVQEAASGTLPVEHITPTDIKEGLQYRRGWAELKNEVLILTQYTGTGTTADQYLNGVVVSDATSISDHKTTAVQEFKDKWGLSEANLTAVATAYVNRWKDGRRWVKASVWMRLLPVEPGDVVDVRSAQLPQGDISHMVGIVMQKDINWLDQTLVLTILELP